MKWNDEKNKTISFQLEADEEAVEFFKRMEQEDKERNDAFKERIKQLFDECVKIDGAEKDSAYYQIMQVFAFGYQHGWNDHYQLSEDKKK